MATDQPHLASCDGLRPALGRPKDPRGRPQVPGAAGGEFLFHFRREGETAKTPLPQRRAVVHTEIDCARPAAGPALAAPAQREGGMRDRCHQRHGRSATGTNRDGYQTVQSVRPHLQQKVIMVTRPAISKRRSWTFPVPGGSSAGGCGRRRRTNYLYVGQHRGGSKPTSPSPPRRCWTPMTFSMTHSEATK